MLRCDKISTRVIKKSYADDCWSLVIHKGEDFVNSLTARTGRTRRLASAAGFIVAVSALGGCASTIADLPYVGLPADAPARKPATGKYLPVHDLPTDRDIAKLDAAERAKLQSELVATRDKQNAAGASAK